MKSVSRIALIALGLVLILGVSGCKKRPVGLTHIPANQAVLPPGEDIGAVDTGNGPAVPEDIGTDNTILTSDPTEGMAIETGDLNTDVLAPEPPIGTADGGIGTNPLTDGNLEQGPREDYNNFHMDRSTFASSTIYFDFDRHNVRSSERVKAEEVAIYLLNQKDKSVLIDGHCDERGTEEYNRALGERRALSVREYLVNIGVAPGRIHTRSFGEDAPAVDAQTEDAYTQNRRAEFILLIPKK